MLSAMGLGGPALSSTSSPPSSPPPTPPPPSLSPRTPTTYTTPFLPIPLTNRPRSTSISRAVSSIAATDPSVSEEELTASSKIGSRVRVKAPLKVYHVPKLPEVDLTGKEGVVKQYVGVWKGKRISANLPFKVEFEDEVEGRGKIKFFAHLREDEFDIVG